MTVQISRPRPPAAGPAPAGPLTRRERVVIEEIAVFAIVASIGWHFAGVAAVGLGLIAVAASCLTRGSVGTLIRNATPAMALTCLVGLGVTGALAGSAGLALGLPWLAVAGWALAAANLATAVRGTGRSA